MKKISFYVFALLSSLAFAEGGETLYGGWKGQAQFQATIAGAPDVTAHAVTSLLLSIEPDGKIQGTSNDNGCRLLGIAIPSNGLSFARVDVTLSGCQYPSFNRRYSGSLARLSKEKNTSTLNLLAIQVGTGKGASSFDIKANLRR